MGCRRKSSRKTYYRKRKNDNDSKAIVKALLFLLVLPFRLIYWFFKLITEMVNMFSRKKEQTTGSVSWDASATVSAEENAQEKGNPYSSKQLVTEMENRYAQVIRKYLPEGYVLVPQVNLASIIQKENSKYRTELFRNVDFGVFDPKYSPVVLIEINDRTHEQWDRRKRDRSVKDICQQAGIPLVSFWVKFGVNETYIQQQLQPYFPNQEDASVTEKR